ncbi:MAG: cadherin-like beta sandwich domain-containing protein [Bacilli bacterium]|nr:cadherin-like beta sandwich domain-containing protein [Bacilli bacterium]
MKKLLYYVVFGLLFLLPTSVKADVAIKSTSLNGPLSVEEGSSFTMTVNVNVSGLSKLPNSSQGIASAIFAFGMDEDVFILESVSAEGFESIAQKVDGVYYILSQSLQNNNCGSGMLYCGDYKVELKFYVKNTTLNSSVITLGEVAMGFIDVETYQTEDDIIVRRYDEYKPHSIVINHKKESAVVESPKTIVEEQKEKPKVTEKPVAPKKEIPKSSNALLKSIVVENYNVDFDTYLLEYTLEVEEGVNSLSIKAEVEDEKANYKIIGAEDLKKNENKVLIEVTAENGNKKVYTINTKIKEQTKEVEKIVEKTEIETQEKVTVNKKFVTYIIIFFGGIVGLVIIGFIISKIRNRKLNKMLDEL